MDADERFPPWLRFSTNDMGSAAGRYMLAAGNTANWADYGRWFALRQILATTPGAAVDASNARLLGSLGRQLGLGIKTCRSWLAALAECGAISAEDWAGGMVCVPDVFNQQEAYQNRVRVNRRNREGSREAETSG